MTKKLSFTHENLLAYIHYDPETGFFTRKIATSWTKVGDKCDCENIKGYLEFNVLGKLVRSHRLAFFYMTGEWPTLQIDHIDGNKKNNQWSNLREVDNKTNCENKRNKNKNNTSGYTGVVYKEKSNKYQAQIRVNGKMIYAGLHDTAELAYEAYLAAKIKYHKGYVNE